MNEEEEEEEKGKDERVIGLRLWTLKKIIIIFRMGRDAIVQFIFSISSCPASVRFVFEIFEIGVHS